jgi:hypothetical protein
MMGWSDSFLLGRVNPLGSSDSRCRKLSGGLMFLKVPANSQGMAQTSTGGSDVSALGARISFDF